MGLQTGGGEQTFTGVETIEIFLEGTRVLPCGTEVSAPGFGLPLVLISVRTLGSMALILARFRRSSANLVGVDPGHPMIPPRNKLLVSLYFKHGKGLPNHSVMYPSRPPAPIDVNPDSP